MIGIALALVPLSIGSPGFTATTTDQIAVIFHDEFDAKQRLKLSGFVPFPAFFDSGIVANDGAGSSPPSIAEPVGFDKSFFRATGQRPLRLAFGADLDGDMTDEILVLREFVDLGGRYLLSVHRAPSGVQNVSQPILRTANDALGAHPQFGAIIAADGIDVDGDLRDEIVVVREVESGAQRIEIYSLPTPAKPTKKSKSSPVTKSELGGPIASYLDVGSAPKDAIVDIAAVDMNGDAKEEIAVLRRTIDGVQTISVISAPKVASDLTPVAFATTTIPFIEGEDPITQLVASDVDSDGIDEVMIRRRVAFIGPFGGGGGPTNGSDDSTDDGSGGGDAPDDGTMFPTPVAEFERIDILPLPTGGTVITGIDPAMPIFIPASGGSVIDEVIVLRGPNPKPGVASAPLEQILNDTFDGSLSHQVNTGGYVGSSEVITVGPFDDAIGKYDGANFTLAVPGATVSIGGTLDVVTGAIDLSGGANTVDLPIPGSGATLHAVFQSVRVLSYGNFAVVQGSYTGVVTGADGKPKNVEQGKLAFTSH